MKKRSVQIISGVLAALLLAAGLVAALPARADGDKAEYEAWQRQLKQRKEEEQRRKAENEARQRAQEVAYKRQILGRDAAGKSDDEVRALYAARLRQQQEDAVRQRQAAEQTIKAGMAKKQAMESDPNFKQKVDAGARMAGGKSFEDLSKMSPEELERLQKEMERKYGKQQP